MALIELYFLQHFLCFTDLYYHADLYIFHIALAYALSVIIFLNTNALLFCITTASEPRCCSLGVLIFLVVCILGWHGSVRQRVPGGWAVSLVRFVWIQFAYGFPTICLMCASFAVYLCTKSSADPL